MNLTTRETANQGARQGWSRGCERWNDGWREHRRENRRERWGRSLVSTTSVCFYFIVGLWLVGHIHAPSVQAQPTSPAPTPTTPRVGTPTPEAEAGDGLMDIIFSGGWVGFLIVALLFGLSMLAAYLVFEQIMTLRKTEIMPDKVSDQVRQLLTQGRIAEADKVCRSKPSFLSFVLLHGLAETDGGWVAVEKALEDATAEQSARLFRKVEYLSVIGNIAPMVGLLGTVTGMIFAFQRVASTQGAAGAGELAEGIYQALVTTVGGLIVAIPSLGAFAIFRNRVDQLVAEAAYLAQHAFTPLKRQRNTQPVPTVAQPQPAATAATQPRRAPRAAAPQEPPAPPRPGPGQGGAG